MICHGLKALVLLSLLSAACTRSDALYCDELTPCVDPGKPYCDLDGTFAASAGVGRTCIADPTLTGVDGGFADAGRPDAVIGCEGTSECPISSPICIDDRCQSCQLGPGGDADCQAKDSQYPICGQSGLCQECSLNSHCDAAAPYCAPLSGTCSPCSAHDQCDSGICQLSTGTCVAEGGIIYVDSGSGSDSGTCGDAQGASACRHVDGVLGALSKVTALRRSILLAPGSYIEAVVIGNLSVEIVGPGATFFPPSFQAGPALQVLGGSSVVFHGVTITGGVGTADGDGLVCRDSTVEMVDGVLRDSAVSGLNSSNCTVELVRTAVRGNQRQGIRVNGGSLVVEQADIIDNLQQGVLATGTALEIKRTHILGNPAGGVRIENSSFVLENNIIAKNGNAVANPAQFAGGVAISNGFSITPQIIRHCTIADNSSPNSLASSGVDCGDSVNDVDCDSNIVVGNIKPAINSPQFAGQCAFRYSAVTGINTGTGNISTSPQFVNVAQRNYRLAPGSPGVDVADPSSPSLVDIDGEARPKGPRHDMGADEL